MSTGLAQFIAARSSRWRSRFSRSSPEHLRLGSRGEKLAARFLRGQGCKVLYRNFRGRRGGEIDLVCREGETLVFVEVKTRTREDFGRPLAAVDQQKRRRISLGAFAWLRLLGNPDIAFRFDVVEVVVIDGAPPKIELIRDAFQLPAPYIY